MAPRITQLIPATGWWLRERAPNGVPDDNAVACFALVESGDVDGTTYQTIRPLLGTECNGDAGILFDVLRSPSSGLLIYDPDRREEEEF